MGLFVTYTYTHIFYFGKLISLLEFSRSLKNYKAIYATNGVSDNKYDLSKFTEILGDRYSAAVNFQKKWFTALNSY